MEHGAKSMEQRAIMSMEHGAKSMEQRAWSKEHGAKSRELRAGSTEHGSLKPGRLQPQRTGADHSVRSG
jgi:hypothetical protein